MSSAPLPPSKASLLAAFRQAGSGSSHAPSAAWPPASALIPQRLDFRNQDEDQLIGVGGMLGLRGRCGRPLCQSDGGGLAGVHSPHPLSPPPSVPPLSLFSCILFCRIMSHVAQTAVTQHDLFTYQLLCVL